MKAREQMSREKQIQFIKECVRVSKKYVFITTPNRFYPIELHTMLPLLHWLPTNIYRKVLCQIGKPFYAMEDNLNLIGRRDLAELVACIGNTLSMIKSIRFLGFKSNLLLIITKQK